MSELQPEHFGVVGKYLLASEKVWSATATDPIYLTPSNRKSQLRLVIYSYLLVSEKVLSARASDPISLSPSNRKSQLCLVIYFLYLSCIHIYWFLKKF